MFTRTYHIYVEGYGDEVHPTHKSSRLYAVKSFFERDLVALQAEMLSAISKEDKIPFHRLLVVSFSRVS